MTDRYCALTVVLDKDIREDDAEPIIAAILCLKHVIEVKPDVAHVAQLVAESRLRRDLRDKIVTAVIQAFEPAKD